MSDTPQEKPAPTPKKAKQLKPAAKVSRLGYYIMFFGWMTLLVEVVMAFEWVGIDIFMKQFLSVEPKAIAFRALALLLPLVFSICGYLVYQREKFLWVVVAKEKKLEAVTAKLSANYKQLSSKVSEHETDAASKGESVGGVHQIAKNNLSMVGGFLGFHTQHVKDEDFLKRIKSDQRRIRVLSAAHEMLASKDGTQLNLKDFLKRVAEDVQFIHGKDKAQLTLDIMPLPVGMDILVPCGLLLSELVANAYEHAFTAKEPENLPEVRVTLMKRERNEVSLRVSDTGVGMPEDMDMNYINFLGFRVIDKMSKLLKGRTERSTDAGVTHEVFFVIVR